MTLRESQPIGAKWVALLSAVVAACIDAGCGATACEDPLLCNNERTVTTCGRPGESCDASTEASEASAQVQGERDAGAEQSADLERTDTIADSGDRAPDAAAGADLSLDADSALDSPVPANDGGSFIGVFVSPNGNDANPGTSGNAPFRSLREAMARAKKEGVPVFACDDGTGFSEPIVVDAALDGITVRGGYDCRTWTTQTNRRTVVRPWAGTTALNISALTAGTVWEGFELRMDDAQPAASNIAVVVTDSKNVVFRNLRVIAGNGGDGFPGANGSKGQDGPPRDTPQLGSRASCPGLFAKQAGGSWSMPSLCGSRGGTGGEAVLGGPGTKGQAGTPQDHVVKPGFDNGGAAPYAGGLGQNGSEGLPGDGGVATPLGGGFTASGFTPGPPGGEGTDGYPGQGGGGGGASDSTGTNCTGASGSAGGVGGCGGHPGKGGASGGASIAILSWTSEIVLDACELSAGTGGTGGKGGDGGPGGTGGDGAGAPTGFWNPDSGVFVILPGGQGGQGGDGGPGGPGAGGNGGPAYALVFHGPAPSLVYGTTLASGVGGRGGLGGSAGPNVRGATGLDGPATQQLSVP